MKAVSYIFASLVLIIGLTVAYVDDYISGGQLFLIVAAIAAFLWASVLVLDSWRAKNPLHFALRVVFNMIWRNIELFSKSLFAAFLIIGGICAMINCAAPAPALPTTGGGPQGEKLAGFANSVLWLPEQVWYGFVGILQILSFILLFFVAGAMGWAVQNLGAIAILLVIAYVVWFVYNVNDCIDVENMRFKTYAVVNGVCEKVYLITPNPEPEDVGSLSTP
jgi:hypothetical protein